jgi:hypothetical protein
MPPINLSGRLSPLGLVLLAATSVGWGLNFPIMKHLLSEWPPLSSRGLCGIAGAAALALFALARRQNLTVPARNRHAGVHAWWCRGNEKGGAGDAPPFNLKRAYYCAGQGCRWPS